MAKKKRKPDGKKQPPHLPDPRALEGSLHALVSSGLRTPLTEAQELMYRAFDEPRVTRQLDMARQALQISPDCADAYVLLAENAGSRKEALELFQQGLAAAERAIGAEGERYAAGHFWGVLETRPYMRAREGLAHCLWGHGQRAEAVDHLREMLRLNPNDNQGLRYVLAGWLLNLDRDGELEALLQQHPDDESALWAYAKVLLAFRKGGDRSNAKELLVKARKVNTHFPGLLTGDEPMPFEQPPHYRPGSKEEAIIFAAMLLPAWRATAGAIEWLRTVEQKSERSPSAFAFAGPMPVDLERLRSLPQLAEVWQSDCRQMPNWVTIGGKRERPWTLLITSRTSNLVLGHDIQHEALPAAKLWDKLAEAMRYPARGRAHRPSEIQVRPSLVWTELQPILTEIGIKLVTRSTLDQLGRVFAEMSREVVGKAEPGLLDTPGVTPEMVGRFFDAAADYYQKAPWRNQGDEGTIQVQCDRLKGGPWYAVVMGQAGMTFGLALYDDLKFLLKLRHGQMSEKENAEKTVALSVTFGDESHLSAQDLDAAHQHGWKVASSQAYPSIFRKERGLKIRPPLPWELELMEACLRTIPSFGQRRRPVPSATVTETVPTATEPLQVTLSWADD